MTNKKLAWALFDDRTGNRQQLLGILNKLDFAYKKIDIKYNKFAFLPNCLIQLFGGFLHIKNKKEFNDKPYPNILIACGRRTAPIAIRLYEKLSCKPFLIQLMYPSLTLKKKLYDMIIVPDHDKTPNLNNLYKFLGTPNQMSDLLIERANKLHGNRYNYDEVLYVNNKTPVKILCPDHGEFLQPPDAHLVGKSCSRCTNKKEGEIAIYLNERFIVHRQFSLENRIFDFYLPDYNQLICTKYSTQHEFNHVVMRSLWVLLLRIASTKMDGKFFGLSRTFILHLLLVLCHPP
mgnify:CR=1 FL=1